MLNRNTYFDKGIDFVLDLVASYGHGSAKSGQDHHNQDLKSEVTHFRRSMTSIR